MNGGVELKWSGPTGALGLSAVARLLAEASQRVRWPRLSGDDGRETCAGRSVSLRSARRGWATVLRSLVETDLAPDHTSEARGLMPCAAITRHDVAQGGTRIRGGAFGVKTGGSSATICMRPTAQCGHFRRALSPGSATASSDAAPAVEFRSVSDVTPAGASMRWAFSSAARLLVA
jgi:hypothetical protein